MSREFTYKKAGVDIQKAESLVSWIKNLNQAPSLEGDYASLHELNLKKYSKPLLASSTDGVGTKAQIASYLNNLSFVGQDLVAMCVNDLICTGAKPLFFLDYYACGRLDLKQAKVFIKGISKACLEASCRLVGGETAELPEMYQKNDFDCAGFSVGIVDKPLLLGKHRVKEGDEILGLKSSGFHSNGYSLIRKVYKKTEWKLKERLLLKPTRLYTFLVPYFDKCPEIHALAHITGGGLDNISRVIPSGLQASLVPWKVPRCFLDIQKKASMSWSSLLSTFNCGIGMILIGSSAKAIQKKIPKEKFIVLGKVVKKRGAKWTLNLSDMQARQK